MHSSEMALYRECTPVVDTRYDVETDQTPTEAVIEALAEASGIDPLELPPVYEFVEPDALDSLFVSHERPAAEIVLGFAVDHWNVFVRGDGRIRVCDGRKPTDPEPIFE